MPVKQSHRELIIWLLKPPGTKYSCQQICKHIIAIEKLTEFKYLSGSISSILAKLVKDGVLEYAEEETPRGGHIYQTTRCNN